MAPLNLRDQLAFYGAYHTHPANQAIHFVFVPLIFWSALVWAAASPPAGPLPAGGLAAAAAAGYSAYYVALDPVAGGSWAALVGLPLWRAAVAFRAAAARPDAWAAAAHAAGWAAQLGPGHALFEGRRPALADSLVQSLVLAPLFVWFEALFALGYRPALRAEVRRRAGAAAAAWRGRAGGGGAATKAR